VWTAVELAGMTPVEQDDIFNASIVNDLDKVRPEFLDRVRVRAAALVEAREASKLS
jgi:hypothetical protein